MPGRRAFSVSPPGYCVSNHDNSEVLHVASRITDKTIPSTTVLYLRSSVAFESHCPYAPFVYLFLRLWCHLIHYDIDSETVSSSQPFRAAHIENVERRHRIGLRGRRRWLAAPPRLPGSRPRPIRTRRLPDTRIEVSSHFRVKSCFRILSKNDWCQLNHVMSPETRNKNSPQPFHSLSLPTFRIRQSTNALNVRHGLFSSLCNDVVYKVRTLCTRWVLPAARFRILSKFVTIYINVRCQIMRRIRKDRSSGIDDTNL